MIAFRKKAAPPHVDQVLKSLSELIEFVRPTGIEIGLENRLHFYDIPLIYEMQSFLDLCDEDWYGFQYDVGHAQVLSELGFGDHEDWLKRYGTRIIGVHLHDVRGINDHQMPGSGDVDYEMINADDDSGENGNFLIDCVLNENETYYLYVSMYDDFKNSDVICIIGFGFNSDESKIS